jgi:hypothetical protein
MEDCVMTGYSPQRFSYHFSVAYAIFLLESHNYYPMGFIATVVFDVKCPFSLNLALGILVRDFHPILLVSSLEPMSDSPEECCTHLLYSAWKLEQLAKTYAKLEYVAVSL